MGRARKPSKSEQSPDDIIILLYCCADCCVDCCTDCCGDRCADCCADCCLNLDGGGTFAVLICIGHAVLGSDMPDAPIFGRLDPDGALFCCLGRRSIGCTCLPVLFCHVPNLEKMNS